MADEVPPIFLSHSGKQKGFVEHLYNDLVSANRRAFFDKHSLPKGTPFCPHIERAAAGCKLGVVVLSDDFLTSKWPMKELNMLVLRPQVIPLFYKISPQDLTSLENLRRWRSVWREKGGQKAEEWERAVKYLDSCNGEVLIPGSSEDAYIKRVVRKICSLVPSPILYDLSPIKGHQRFTREVESQFEEAARQSSDKVCACMVGLYGVAGLGKTTICKLMVNFYASQYPGKSHLIEFPSDGDDKKIVEECKKALQKLVNLSDEHLLKNVDSFDEVVQLMKRHLGPHDVFLAIDNVWEGKSVEAAKRMLRVGFSSNSKILLTSRSEAVLTDLVSGHSNTRLRPLPSPDQQEAFLLFQQEALELGDLNSLVINTNLLHRVLKTCFFSGNYHALALKAVAQHVKRVCKVEGLDKLERSLSDILQGVRNDPTIFENVDNLIKLNYDNLSAVKKHMFLDIVVVVMAAASNHHFEVMYEMAHQWLSILYYKKAKYSKTTITKLISELASDGLIQLENKDDTSSQQMIRVHDLYADLAQREAASSSRFFTDRSTRSLKEIEWKSLERVILRDLCHRQYSACFIKELQQQECQNLQVLSAENIDLRSDIHLDLMPSLCVLKLESGNLTSIENWHDAKGLAIVSLVNLHCTPPLKRIPSIPCLESLIIRNVKTVQRPPINLDGCQHLKNLVLAEASVFQYVSYFSSLTSLESLEIVKFDSIPRVLNLNGLVNIKSLLIKECESVERIDGLDALKNLQSLFVQKCPCLRNLDGLTSPALKLVDVRGCEALKRTPDLSGLTGLEELLLYDNKSMEEVVGGLTSPALKLVDVRRCEALPDLSGLW